MNNQTIVVFINICLTTLLLLLLASTSNTIYLHDLLYEYKKILKLNKYIYIRRRRRRRKLDHRRIISIKYFTLLWPKYVAKGMRELVSPPWQKGTHTHTLPLRTNYKPVRSTKRLAFFKPPEVRLHDNFWQPQHVIQTHCELTPSVSQIHPSNHINIVVILVAFI